MIWVCLVYVVTFVTIQQTIQDVAEGENKCWQWEDGESIMPPVSFKFETLDSLEHQLNCIVMFACGS